MFSGGHTRGYWRTTKPAKWRQAAVYIGGALANGLVCGLTFVALNRLSQPPHSLPETGLAAVFAFAFANALGLINLLPFHNKAQNLASDGRLLLRLFRKQRVGEGWEPDMHEALSLMACGRDNEVAPYLEAAVARHPTSPALLALLIDRIGRAQGPKAAWQTYQARVGALPDAPNDDPSMAWLSLNAAWEALRMQDPALLEVAEVLSRTECKAIADLPVARGTRGAIQIERGLPGEGLALLGPAIRGIEDSHDKAGFCAYLARAQRESGAPNLEAEFLKLRDHLLAA